ncbi:HEAT repeat domain-containing protein [Cylindrospermopsis raciborskii CHAB3438]|uniref:HEAT repeat domain-containing protein n=1 Tax=Cylindrospermopsis raciborskii CS-506_A TaxID=2585140 RepID=A0A838WIQ7_9CYAN|nr:HEAT repeat domain-containing protein [Cylindrospermopsis raciborskii]MBA4445536.1 HEAT repeat domain-containing protein [Cylindrospermopsis raciborskii CS-506_C]MBA4449770.1 HEAT repeat domain-containing protein [Cylindrospermopsis raciborskii CS-506_D]MBA4456388.1 HEAT repeat domain-containing protein [Cylindrospermopsis raciborskii CS-506_B]MBA4465734.1 HEAT repeat domain-containing protein [Cylindrospermopsis raciborskii CS-506_A]MCH4905774.1 HEAT repeat domain-containing protein [Cylin
MTQELIGALGGVEQLNQLIDAVNQAETPLEMVTAVRNLAAAKSPAAIATLIAVFGYNNPPAAGVALAALTDLGTVAVPSLLAQIDDYNYGARAYSIRTLAAIADPRALDVLITAGVTDFAPSVRRAAAKGLGNLNWSQLGDNERDLGIERALEALLLIYQDTDWSIRYAAIVGLEYLGKTRRETILNKFREMIANEEEKSIRIRIQLATSKVTRDN